jgi:steroid delta-isomerase-like uncharacterized protein
MVEANLAAMKRWFEEVWNHRRMETIYELVAPDCVIQGVSETGETLHGPGAFVLVYQRLVSAFPDIRITVEDCFGAGDRIVARWSATMRHTGNGLGIEPTGAPLQLSGITIVRFADGQVVESWDQWDKLAMFKQIEAATAKSAGA